MKEQEKGLLSRDILVDIFPRVLYRIHSSEESQERGRIIRETLDENRNLNFVIYFNHICYEDPWFVGHIVDKFDPNVTRHLVAPISYSHTETTRTKDSTLKIMRGLADKCDVETIRIIQAYQVNNPEYGYTQEQANATYKKLFNRIRDLKDNNIPTGLIISPEGTRSKTGTLEEAERGIVLFGKILEPVLFIPVGIYYDQKFFRNKPNIGKSLNLEIGETYLYEKGKERKDIDFYMNNLAKVLPEKMRGKWANMPISR